MIHVFSRKRFLSASPIVLFLFAIGCSASGTDNETDSTGTGGEQAGSGGQSPGGSGSANAGTGGDAASGEGTSTGGAQASGGALGSGGADGTGGTGVTDPNDPTVGCVETTGQALQDLGDGTLFDPNTCLMWMKTPFTEADSGVEGEVTGIRHVQSCDTRVEAGRDDWRGPDIAEMRTMTTGCGTWSDSGYLVSELEVTGAADSEYRYWTATPGNDADHTCLLIGAKGTFDGGRRLQNNTRVTCVRGVSSLTGSETNCSRKLPLVRKLLLVRELDKREFSLRAPGAMRREDRS
jgi:hypothetical protein